MTMLANVLPQQDNSDQIELPTDQKGWRKPRLARACPPLPYLLDAEQPMILLALEDITDERRIVRQQLQLLIDALPGAFLAVDSQRRMRFVSVQAETLFGYRAKELVGQPLDMLMLPEARNRLEVAFVEKPTSPQQFLPGIDAIAKGGQRSPRRHRLEFSAHGR